MSRPEVISLDVKFAEEKNENIKEKEFALTKLKNFVMRQFFPIGAVLSIILGIFVPQPAVYISERTPLVQVFVMVILFSIGLQLRFQEAKSAIKSYKEVLLGLTLVLFVRPIFAANVLNQVQQFGPFIRSVGEGILKNNSNSSIEEMPILGPEEFRLALQIFFMCPSPIVEPLIMVTAANGHRGLSILVSILTTTMSVFTIPPMLVWSIPSLQHINIDVGNVMLNTVIWILLPMVIGRSLRFLSRVKKVVKKWDNTIKYTVISLLLAIFLVKVSETSASGNLKRVSIVNIVCVVALGTSLATFNLIVSYGVLSILPWFSKKSAVTLSVVSSIPVVVIAFIIIDVLPDNAGDKGLLTLPGIFVFLAILLVLNCFVAFAKVREHDSDDTKNELQFVEEGETEDVKETNLNSKFNEVAVCTIYTDEISIEEEKL